MTTTVRTEANRVIDVEPGYLAVTIPSAGSTIAVALSKDEAKTLAAALDPDRATGGQWTRELEGELWAAVRDELRRVFPSPTDHDHRKLDVAASASVDAVREKLNVHHPKPAPYDQGGWPKSDAVGAAWKRLYEQAEHARDAAVARAEQAEDRVRALEAAPARSTWCPKILLELLRAQSIYSPDEVTGDAIQTLGRVIAQHRPVGPDGKHGDRHTASCGCEDLAAVYPVVKVHAPTAVADTKLEDEAVSHAYWVAKQLGCHVDYLDELTLVEMSKRVVEKAERERDEADRRSAPAEADRDRWKLHHDRVDGQWAKAEREVTRLRGTGAVFRAEIEKAIDVGIRGTTDGDLIDPDADLPAGECVRLAIDAVWALVSGADPAVHIVRESDLPEVERDEDGNWARGGVLVYGGSAELEMVRKHAVSALSTVADCEAVARAIEAEQAVDPVEARVRELEKASAATKDGIEKAIKDQLAAEGWHATSVLIDAAVKGVCEYLYPALRKMAWAAPDLPASLPEVWENDSGSWESAGRLMPASNIPRLRALLDNAIGDVAFYTAITRAIENKPPAPHPVEALAEELFKVGHPEFALDWSNVLEHTRDVYRRMARHTIVERKADQ